MKKRPIISSTFLIAVITLFFSMCNKEPLLNPIVDTSWEVWSITSPNRIYIIISPTPYEINFQKEDILTMSLDVNTCGGTYKVENNTDIHIEPLYCTEICCDKPFADTLLNILPKVNSYKITGEDLELISSNRIINLTKITKEN